VGSESRSHHCCQLRPSPFDRHQSHWQHVVSDQVCGPSLGYPASPPWIVKDTALLCPHQPFFCSTSEHHWLRQFDRVLFLFGSEYGESCIHVDVLTYARTRGYGRGLGLEINVDHPHAPNVTGLVAQRTGRSCPDRDVTSHDCGKWWLFTVSENAVRPSTKHPLIIVSALKAVSLKLYPRFFQFNIRLEYTIIPE